MYCVNCGVKLADSQKVCPLCDTVVFHPDFPRQEGESLYPENTMPVPQVSSRGAQIIATALFLLPMLITFQCDLLINRSVTWSGYVLGALGSLYVWFVLPGWFRKIHPAVVCGADFTAVGLFLLYISLATGGKWFLSFAFPVTGFVGLLATAVVVLMRYVRRGRLYIIGGAFAALGAFMPVMELLLCITFEPLNFYGWSVYPATPLILLGGTLIFLALNKRAREKMEKKFFI